MRLGKPEGEDKETARIEAFSDGVYAIAVTLLVLEIHVPKFDEVEQLGGLTAALTHQWPSYLSYVISFLSILIMWINHHKLFQLVRRKDHNLLVLNGLLLMGITLIPFPTAVLADYMMTKYVTAAAVVYSGSYLLIAILYNLLWRHISAKLIRHDHDIMTTNAIDRQYNIGLLTYVVVFVIAFFWPYDSIVINLVLAMFFALPEHLVAKVTGHSKS
jgi:uncharacterized membrane protein